MKIFLKQVLLIGIILVVLHACGPQGSPIEYQGKISENNNSQPPVNKNLIFQIGDNVQLGDYVVKVISFTDIATRNEPFGPEKGNKFFAI